MCGIIGITGRNIDLRKSINMLKRLEYRGYDSAGIAVNTGKNIFVEKGKGRIEEAINEDRVLKKIGEETPKTTIAHSRWSTHGKPVKKNSHPHNCCNGDIAIIHNGIISNYEELKKELQSKGHKFTSDTDTETIVHLMEEEINGKERSKREILKAIQKVEERIEGEYAVLALLKGKDELYGFKKDSPLCLGINPDKRENYFSSDIYSFSDLTNQSIALENGEKAVINSEEYEVYDENLEKIEKKPERFEWNQEKTKKKEEHHMLSEIKEQPETVKRLMEKQSSKDIKRLTQMIKSHDKIVLTASGTSYHAALLGAHTLQKEGIDTQAIIASEYKNYILPNENTLTIGISQSGETMDVIKSLEYAERKGSTTASIVNVPKTTMTRKTEQSVKIHAGQEISVASTKTFTNQVITLKRIANEINSNPINKDIQKIPQRMNETIMRNEEKIKDLSKEIKNTKDLYIIGEGSNYPIAREIALKIKEIPYIHAEGMMAGELKHGTLALIEENTPVISLRTNNKILKTEEEIKSKGARVIPISKEAELEIPDGKKLEKSLCTNLTGQLLSYYLAKERGCSIDKPRNLAKAVTVQ